MTPPSDLDKVSRGQRGMALVMVMGVLATVMLLVSHLMTVSELVSRESYAVSAKGLLRYRAESAAETAYWLHLTDRRLFSDRMLGQTADDDDRVSWDFPPWMLDGRPHLMDEERTCVTLTSGENGINKKNLSSQLKSGRNAVDDADYLVAVDEFAAALADYEDSNDLRSLNGYERDDYAADGFPTLPRNGTMEFKAEFYWLPGWQEVINREIATLPPSGISYTYKDSGRTSIYAATQAEIAEKLGLDEDDVEVLEVMEALRRWREDGIPLDDTLDATLLISLQSDFTFAEAGVALLESQAYDGQRELMAGYRIVREAKISSRTFFADKKKECLCIWERKWR